MPPLPRHQTLYPRFFKRLLDIAGALVLLSLLAPFLLLLALIIAVNSRGCPIFTQWRIGRGCVPFRIIKFKTMTDERDEDGNLLPDEKRLTKIGRLVRSTSIDELPQLINVLRGDMALIGPRPLLPQYLPLYSEEQARRHEVRPGITGWAQCQGRNLLKFSKKFEYDVWYVDHCSFTLDLKIVRMTIKKVSISRNDKRF